VNAVLKMSEKGRIAFAEVAEPAHRGGGIFNPFPDL
jgi:hypothetical protein